MSYRKSAHLWHNARDPLENTVGHWTSHDNGDGTATLSFHPWDISHEAHEERLAAGPAVMPSQHDYEMAEIREAGRRHGEEVLANIAKSLFPDEWPKFGAAMLHGVPAREKSGDGIPTAADMWEERQAEIRQFQETYGQHLLYHTLQGRIDGEVFWNPVTLEAIDPRRVTEPE